MSDKEGMKNDMVRDLAGLLVQEYSELNLDKALSVVFNSDTYQKIQDENTRLYFQSPRYVYSYLQNELATGRIC